MTAGIANPQLKADGLQIRRNENGKNECRQCWRHSLYSQKIYVRFISSSLHQSRSTKDGGVIIRQFGNADLHAALEDEAEMLLKRRA